MTSARAPQFPWALPYITVSNIDEAVEFYARAFGFILKEKHEQHAEMFYKDELLMFGTEGKSPKASGVDCPINMYLYCENIDSFYQKIITQGAETLSPPENMPWGDRMCIVKCPDGYRWAFATHLGIPCDQL